MIVDHRCVLLCVAGCLLLVVCCWLRAGVVCCLLSCS